MTADNAPHFRHVIEALSPYSAGRASRDVPAGAELAPLAANEGPYGPFPAALNALQAGLASVNRYPESGFGSLRRALAQCLQLAPERVAVTAGGIALIHHLSLALLDPDDEILQCSPTFHAYDLDARKLGARTVSAPLTRDGSYDLDAMRERISARTRLIYVCNPNNPTGGIVERDALLKFVRAVPSRIVILVDEAYCEYVDASEYPDTACETEFQLPNLLTLRTFSKAYGLAGLRVAYALGAPAIIRAIAKVQSNYEVTSLSQAAALASLSDLPELTRRQALNRSTRTVLVDGLQQLGLRPLPTHANFVCLPVGDAKAVAQSLESHGVIVRPLDAMGDPRSIRITVGTEPETQRVLRGLATLQAAGKL